MEMLVHHVQQTPIENLTHNFVHAHPDIMMMERQFLVRHVNILVDLVLIRFLVLHALLPLYDNCNLFNVYVLQGTMMI